MSAREREIVKWEENCRKVDVVRLLLDRVGEDGEESVRLEEWEDAVEGMDVCEGIEGIVRRARERREEGGDERAREED